MDPKRKAKKVDKKKELCFEIAAIVRKIQKQYISTQSKSSGLNGNRSDPAAVASDGDQQLAVDVETLCCAVEAMFLHELKNSKGVLWREMQKPNPAIPPEPSFWLFIDPVVSDEIKMQLLALRNSECDVRKCRSWIRLMLAKKMMISFLEDLQRHPGLLAFHYGGGALLRDPEQSEIVIQLLKGLAVLQLHYDHTNPKLDTWDHTPLRLSGMWEGPPDSKPGSGASTPRSLPSPSHPSPSVQRVSPPSSDFDFEGVTIIDMAMDKYSRRRASSSKLTDNQLISKEIAGSLSSTPKRQRGESSTSIESNSSLLLDGEGGGGGGGGREMNSYGAMLRSYAAKREETQVGGGGERGAGVLPSAGGGGTRGGQEVMWEGREEEEGEGEGERGEDVNSQSFAVALSLNYEIISSDGSLVESEKYEPLQQQKLVMVEHLVKLVNEKGLDSQNYKCCSCSRDIGLIFGQAKLCKFNGQHYCYDCHRDDERVIPARVLFNWDFRTHKVCLASCEFLDSIELSPILDVEKVNKALYLYIPALEESLKLRQQCRYLKDYLVTCKEQEVLEQFRKRLHSSHIYEEVHKYSMKDLVEVNNGAFNDRLKKLVKFAIKHVKQCPLCSQKGFICEVCHDPRVIYPFDLANTSQCLSCKSVYHKVCHTEKGTCPKCLRLRKRADSLV